MSTAGEISGERSSTRYTRHDDDFYVEPPWTIDVLVEAWAIPATAWDPACGCGTIPRALVANGIAAVGSDIADRGYGLRHDFLGAEPAPHFPAAIICNPPYGLAEEFARRALGTRATVMALLVQAKFLYSQRRHALFTEHPPAAILHLSSRPSMPPGDLLLAGTIEAKGGKMDFCWVIWDRGHAGPTITKWAKRAHPGGIDR